MALPNQIDPLFVATNGSSYSIGHSLRFRSSASAYLNRTPATAGSQQKWTWSGWAKRGALSYINPSLFSCNQDDNNRFVFGWVNSDQFIIYNIDAGTNNLNLTTTAVYRDPSAWYHIVVSIDTTQATASNRAILYINGQQVTAFSTAIYPSQNTSLYMNSARQHRIGSSPESSPKYFDGYMAEINFIDNQQLTPSSFGAYDINGVWQPAKYTGTYGTNGFYLPFSNGTSTTTLGYDFSGNSNNWTTNNISLTAGSTYDWMQDVPVNNSATAANFAVMNPIVPTGSSVISGGNLNIVGTGTYCNGLSTINLGSGAFYAECVVNTHSSEAWGVWDITKTAAVNSGSGTSSGFYGIYSGGATLVTAGIAGVTNGSGTPANGDIVQVAWNNGKVWLGKNNVWYNSSFGTTGDPSAGTNPTFSSLTVNQFAFIFGNGNATASLSANFGQRPFTYTPPTGFVALNTYNLPTPTITNGAQYMASTLYTGTGATATISNGTNNTIGTTFQPDFVWIKSRSAATNHNLFDVRRGTTAYINSNTTAITATNANTLTAFGSTGFTLGSDASAIGVNVSAATYDAWQWKASNSSGVTNTSGSITSTVSANTTSGFSIVTYTGTGANATVGHGLGVAPNMILVKKTSGAGANWAGYHSGIGNTASIALNLTSAINTNVAFWQNTTPTSTVFSVGSSGDNNFSGTTQVAYCFAAVAGYSAFGSYTGNGSADGPFVYTGFRPRWVMIKETVTVSNWNLWDSSRNPYNLTNLLLRPNSSAAEGVSAGIEIDILSNGFKIRGSSGDMNTNGETVIYAAFAENPFTMSRAR